MATVLNGMYVQVTSSKEHVNGTCFLNVWRTVCQEYSMGLDQYRVNTCGGVIYYFCEDGRLLNDMVSLFLWQIRKQVYPWPVKHIDIK